MKVSVLTFAPRDSCLQVTSPRDVCEECEGHTWNLTSPLTPCGFFSSLLFVVIVFKGNASFPRNIDADTRGQVFSRAKQRDNTHINTHWRGCTVTRAAMSLSTRRRHESAAAARAVWCCGEENPTWVLPQIFPLHLTGTLHYSLR